MVSFRLADFWKNEGKGTCTHPFEARFNAAPVSECAIDLLWTRF